MPLSYFFRDEELDHRVLSRTPMTDQPFEDFVRHVFEQPSGGDVFERTEDAAAATVEFDHREVIAHLTRLFESPEFLLDRYDRCQIGKGLWYVASTGGSAFMFALHDPTIPWSRRRRCIASIFTLFERLVGPQCGDKLGHLIRTDDDNHLHTACYMWWEIFPTWASASEADNNRFSHAMLDVMERTLTLPSEAACESALHGLGHEEIINSARVQEIIDAFLNARPDISPALRSYAIRAREGGIQ